MDRFLLHSTLRQLQAMAMAPRLWMSFIIVVAMFTITGPYGSAASMALPERLGYWLLVHSLTWPIALVCIASADVLLRPRLPSRLLPTLVGSVLASLPMAYALALVDLVSGLGHPGSALAHIPALLPLCLLLGLMNHLMLCPGTREPADVPAASFPVPEVEAEAEIFERLKPPLRAGRLLRLSAQDHYTEVVTTTGRELVLIRFSDALRETGATCGLQVHRSHWVATEAVMGSQRRGDRVVLRLKDGTEIPVSRSRAAEVRDRFG